MSTNFSLTNRDLEASRKEGISQLPIVSDGKWTDLNPTDPGIIILDYVHALVDMIQFYQDHQALETYMTTAKERRNILKIAKQLSYKSKSSAGSTVSSEFYVDIPLNDNIIIPEGTIISSQPLNKTYYFMTLEEVILYAGQTEVLVSAKEGERTSITYQGTGVSELSQTQSPSNQYIVLQGVDIDTSTIYITDDTGHRWEEVDFIFFSTPNERRYEVELTPENLVRIKFGNGQRGKVPLENDMLTVSYMRTNGSDGNLGTGMIDTIVTHKGNNINLSILRVRNISPATGGSDPQTNESIRNQAPMVHKTQWRAVTTEDFEVLAREVPGVATVRALDIKNSPETCLHHEVKLIVVPEGGSSPSRFLKDEVFNYLYERMIPPAVLQVIDPIHIDIDFSFTVGVDKRFLPEEIEYSIRETLDNYFQDLGSSFGTTIMYTQLINLISNVYGVKYIDKFSLLNNIVLGKIEMARLGTVDIEFIEEG